MNLEILELEHLFPILDAMDQKVTNNLLSPVAQNQEVSLLISNLSGTAEHSQTITIKSNV